MKAAGVSVNCDRRESSAALRHPARDTSTPTAANSKWISQVSTFLVKTVGENKALCPKLVPFFFLSGPSNVSYPEGNLAPSKFATRRWNYFLLFIFWYH